MQVVDSVLGRYSISIHLNFKDSCVSWITGVYGPSSHKVRDDFWQELLDLNGLCADNWCLGGDFNVMRRIIAEKFRGGRVTRSMKNFNQLIEELNVVDVPMKQGLYTWSDGRERPVATRIDIFLLPLLGWNLSKRWSSKTTKNDLRSFPSTSKDGKSVMRPLPFSF